MNVLINLVIIAIVVIAAFWILGLIAAALALPAILITLLKILIVIMGVVWLIDAFRGGRFTLYR